MLPALSAAELLTEVLTVPRHAYVPVPDLRVIERAGWMQLVTPSFKDGGMNEVSLARLDPHDADAAIDRTIAEYRALGIKFRWSVGIDSRPDDLGVRLARRGLVPTVAHGMACATAIPIDQDPDIVVREVDATTVGAYTQAMARGWDVAPAPLARANELVLSHPDRRHRLYLAYLGGEPAGTASTAMFERSAHLLGAVVLPEARRHGVYRALVAARLAAARERGLVLATSMARATTSAPLLARLGFEKVTEVTHYHG